MAEQHGGDHYQVPVQHWDWAQYLGYLEGNATKYLGRHQQKGGINDIAKALTYIEKIIERDYPEAKLNWELTTEGPTRNYVDQG